MRRRLFGDDHPGVDEARIALARVLVALDRPVEAEEVVRWAMEGLEQQQPAGHWRTAESSSVLAACHAVRDRHAEAEPLLRTSLAMLRDRRGEAAPSTRAALGWLEALVGAGSSREAAPT